MRERERMRENKSTECVHDACVRDHERERMRENKSTDCVQEEQGE